MKKRTARRRALHKYERYLQKLRRNGVLVHDPWCITQSW